MFVKYELILVPKHEIVVPKIANLGCFNPEPYLKWPNARKFLNQNGDQFSGKHTHTQKNRNLTKYLKYLNIRCFRPTIEAMTLFFNK